MLRSKTSSRSAQASADDLADPRRQHVHRRDGAAVVVQSHVEGLDALRVVHHDDRLLCVFLGQIALVLRLQVDPHLTGNSNFSFARSSTSMASP
jgi:hypothetical protein